MDGAHGDRLPYSETLSPLRPSKLPNCTGKIWRVIEGEREREREEEQEREDGGVKSSPNDSEGMRELKMVCLS